MEEQETKVTQYLVPANVSTKFEFIEGFGWKELLIVAVALAIGTMLFLGLGLPKKITYVDLNGFPIKATNSATLKAEEMIPKKVPVIPSIARAFAIIIPGVGAFFLVKRDPSNGMSLLNTVQSLKEFKKRQKLYLYKYESGTED